MTKDELTYVVEVKLYSKTNPIDRGKIQKLHSAMIDSGAEKAIFVTTSRYTKHSIEYANKFDINLIDGEKLVKLIEKATKEIPEKLDDVFG